MLKPRQFLPPAPDPQISWPAPKTLNPKPLKPLNPEPALLFSVAQAALGLRAAKAPPRGREPLPRTKPSSPGHFLLYVRVCIYIVYMCMYVCKYIYICTPNIGCVRPGLIASKCEMRNIYIHMFRYVLIFCLLVSLCLGFRVCRA